MYFNFRYPDKKEEAQISEAERGLLKVEVPHWAAEVKIYDSLFQPVSEIGKIKSDPKKSGGYLTETSLPPGVYQVETILEGRASSEWIPVRPNQVTEVSGKAWKNLVFTSSAPLENTDTSREWHQGPAEEWSRKPTWKHPQGGNSRLFLFVRTLKPERYRETFSEGLQLLNENGELVTDLTDGIEQNKRSGWMAFNAYLPSGGYILRRGRSGVRLRSQVIYLCEDWKTQVFLNAKRFPSLSTMSLNMTRLESGFQANDQSSLAVEAILNNLRYGADIQSLFSNEKIETILDALLHQKKENPWLGILVAHIILKFRDEMNSRQASQIYLDQTIDFSEYFQILEDKVKPFLQRTIPQHPDARALLLSEHSPDSFDFPPMLWASLERVQRHALKFVETIPKDSLTDCLLDNLLVNAPWTAWRTLTKLPNPSPNLPTFGKRLFDIRVSKPAPIAVSTACFQTDVPKILGYRFSQDDDIAQSRSSAQFPAAQTILQDAPIIQKATEIVKDFVQSNRLEDLPEKVNLNSTEKINEILGNVRAEEISQTFGLPLSRTESGLESLKSQAENIQFDEPPVAVKPERTMLCSQQIILEYALSKVEQNTIAPSPEEVSAANLSISSLIGKLRNEADRLWLNASKSSEELRVRDICVRLNFFSRNLLKFAEFVLLSSFAGRILYSNRSFVLLISSTDEARVIKSDGEIKNLLNENRRLWEATLSGKLPGFSEVQNPLAGQDFQHFELSRAEIQDDAEGGSICHLNILRLKEFMRLPEEKLREIDLTISKLAQYALLFSYGSAEIEADYINNLQKITENFENFF